MKEFEFNDARAFILSSGVEPFLTAFGAYRSRGEHVIMRHLGLTRLDPGAKYPLSGFMAAMRELQEQFGPAFMRKMGSLIMENAAFPRHLDSIEKVLGSLDDAYWMNHDVGGAEIGHYRWTPTDSRSGTMFCDNPYPCAMDVGLLESMIARFTEPKGKVIHVVGPCRHRGGDSCTYRLEW